jgi:hypothetical protein
MLPEKHEHAISAEFRLFLPSSISPLLSLPLNPKNIPEMNPPSRRAGYGKKNPWNDDESAGPRGRRKDKRREAYPHLLKNYIRFYYPIKKALNSRQL